MKEDSLSLSHRLRRLINMGLDKAPEEEIIAGIEEGVSFQGAKLWILVLAIFVASLGLNTNSTAVIIGAMLISPLMGPIIGMGLGVGVYDFSLLKRAFRNYLVATAFSVVTATVYFLIMLICSFLLICELPMFSLKLKPGHNSFGENKARYILIASSVIILLVSWFLGFSYFAASPALIILLYLLLSIIF